MFADLELKVLQSQIFWHRASKINTRILVQHEERRGGATGTCVSQKDLQLGNTNNENKALEKLAEKEHAHCKLELGAMSSEELESH